MDVYKGKTILVTGGTGSFGRNFVRFLLEHSEAKKIIVFSRDELKQSEMHREMRDERLRFFLGDVRDVERLRRAFHGVNIVVHAAALKQVPTLEYNPFEAVKTNILGSENVINAAIDLGVDKVVLISTDKAVQPANLYGSTKQCAEKLFIAGNFYAAGRTKFSCVRYGNVIASRGSIIEILLREKGAKQVSITDENMTRFWLSLPESFALVTFALSNMVGGEIFIPKEISSMRVGDLFSALAPETERKMIGARPGEKIHEILLPEEEARRAFEFEGYYVVLPNFFHPVVMERFNTYREQGIKLPEDFSFRSDTNSRWLTKEELLKILEL